MAGISAAEKARREAAIAFADRREKEHEGHEIVLNLYALAYGVFFLLVIFFPNIMKAIDGDSDATVNAVSLSSYFSEPTFFKSITAIYWIISIAAARFVFGSLFANHDSSFREALYKSRTESYRRDFIYTLSVVKLLMVFSLARTYLLFYDGFLGISQTIFAGFLVGIECFLIYRYDREFKDILLNKDSEKKWNKFIIYSDYSYIIAALILFICAPLTYLLSSQFLDTIYLVDNRVLEGLTVIIVVSFLIEFFAVYPESYKEALKDFRTCVKVIFGFNI